MPEHKEFVPELTKPNFVKRSLSSRCITIILDMEFRFYENII